MSKGRNLRPRQVAVTLSVPLLGEIQGTWEPDEAERNAAWELYVELVTRVSAVELPPGQGLLREALSSLYDLFRITRDILRRYGPEIAPARAEGELSFGVLAVTVLNGSLRPLLTEWHPLLRAYEETRPEHVDPVSHERAWEREPDLRAALEESRRVLTDLADLLGEIAGAADLRNPPATEEKTERGGELNPGFRCRRWSAPPCRCGVPGGGICPELSPCAARPGAASGPGRVRGCHVPLTTRVGWRHREEARADDAPAAPG
ncbi:hypothetical protein RIF23_18270 [Lipingzhangella sp. LS1_29]|uniref:Uncharacterized protein n=1 Tax=Lipingzhangella rawalii TaxID=2055835 RepID=A0ABU2HAG3_9ACTN|nr:hypothetical protein [Lipingzhangella rawalii]MDS1272238.1 hypothetical protein [Lipingzhangella rawalii]